MLPWSANTLWKSKGRYVLKLSLGPLHKHEISSLMNIPPPWWLKFMGWRVRPYWELQLSQGHQTSQLEFRSSQSPRFNHHEIPKHTSFYLEHNWAPGVNERIWEWKNLRKWSFLISSFCKWVSWGPEDSKEFWDHWDNQGGGRAKVSWLCCQSPFPPVASNHSSLVSNVWLQKVNPFIKYTCLIISGYGNSSFSPISPTFTFISFQS